MKETQWLNNVRAVATIAVILVHILGVYINKFGEIPITKWTVLTFVGSVLRFCVPVFLMITGALLLGKDYSLSSFLKKRFSRILFPFLFWSILYVFIHEGFLFPKSLHELKTIFFKPAAFHLWYIYMLIGIYLIIPLINEAVKGPASKFIIPYYLLIWMITTFLNLPILSKLPISIEIRYFTGYLGYAILGYYLTLNLDKIKKYKKFALPIFLIGIIITFAGTLFYTYRYQKFAPYFFSYLTPNVALMSIGLLVGMMSFSISNEIVKPGINFISKYSYGIYLSHIAALSLLNELFPKLFNSNPVNILLVFLLCIIFSTMITFIFHRIPFGKYISG